MNCNEFFSIKDQNTKDMAEIIIHTRHFRKQDDYTPITVHILDLLSKALLLSQKNGFNQYTVNVNMQKTKMKHMDISFFKSLTDLLSKTFPEALYRCYILNFPSLLKPIYHIFDGFLDKRTKGKMVFVKSSTYKENQHENEKFNRMPIAEL